MEPRTEDSKRYHRAKARVEALRSFYIHAATFAVIIGVLIFVDALTGDGWWFYWATLGWGRDWHGTRSRSSDRAHVSGWSGNTARFEKRWNATPGGNDGHPGPYSTAVTPACFRVVSVPPKDAR